MKKAYFNCGSINYDIITSLSKTNNNKPFLFVPQVIKGQNSNVKAVGEPVSQAYK